MLRAAERSSTALGGLVGLPGRATYHATKHRVIGFTRSAALEYASRGVRINTIRPGTIDTPMVTALMADGERNADGRGSFSPAADTTSTMSRIPPAFGARRRSLSADQRAMTWACSARVGGGSMGGWSAPIASVGAAGCRVCVAVDESDEEGFVFD